MELLDTLKKRRSYREYTDKPVSALLIDQLMEASTMAPVSCNLQLTQYVVINDQKKLEELSKKVSYKFRYAPCSIVVLHDARFLIDRASGIMSAGMAVQNILLRATDLGLATCPMAGFKKDEKIKIILNIPPHMEIMLIIAVGYAKHEAKTSIPKIAMKDSFNLNNYGGMSTIKSSLNLSDYSINDIINYRKRIAPVYLSRFRLNSYNSAYYQKISDLLWAKVFSKNKPGEILDLMSYDGVFIKSIHESNLYNSFSITSSDYLKHNLDFFSKELGIKSALISLDNSILSDKSFDYITFIFQLDFTPDVSLLIKNATKLLRIKGLFIVAVIEEVWYKNLAKKLLALYQKFVLRKSFNIYENNPFYKIGPMEHHSERNLTSLAASSSLALVNKYYIANGRTVKIKIFVFRKN